ncbi:MAG: hypothetical protein GY953_48150, partial [bacterium]|nr:hypothetical protein [bacterium]
MTALKTAIATILLLAPAMADSYVDSIEKWRAVRQEALKAEDGWLSVAGLFWLKPGPNTFGTANSNDIVFPPGSVPAEAGVIELRAGRTTLRKAGSAEARLIESDVRRFNNHPHGAGALLR